jgi:hypothetical protein
LFFVGFEHREPSFSRRCPDAASARLCGNAMKQDALRTGSREPNE